MLFKYGKYVIDIESMTKVNFACSPDLCLKVKNGRYYGSCCTDYLVDVALSEQLALVKLLERSIDICAKKYPWLLKKKIFKKNKKGVYYLTHKENGACVFGKTRGNKIFCVVDLLCEELKLDRKKYKPSTCFSWPFELIDMENKEKETFVTFINAMNAKYMSQDTACLKCVSGRYGRPAYLSMKNEIIHYTGQKTYSAMLKFIKGQKNDSDK